MPKAERSPLNQWDSLERSPQVPSKILLRKPFVRWALLLLVMVLLYKVMDSWGVW